jgi:formylmethanofuran dehydrogenase subunit D
MDDFLVDGEKLGSSEGDKTLVIFRNEGTVVLEAAKNGHPPQTSNPGFNRNPNPNLSLASP